MHKKTPQRYNSVIKTPFAVLGLVIDDGVLERVDYLKSNVRRFKPKDNMAKKVCLQIENYCANKLDKNRFDIACQATGTTFQKKVWKQIKKIPFGKTRTYGDIAKTLKTSPRAVGNACRANPLVLVVPCHRVVSAKGPGGYSGKSAGQMVKIKQWLLAHENNP